MKTSKKYYRIAIWMILGVVGSAVTAHATEREFAGEVVRVAAASKRVVLKVPSSKAGEIEELTVQVDNTTRLQGVQDLSELKEGTPVQVAAKKDWFRNWWVAERLFTSQPQQPHQRQGLNSVETAELHKTEDEFAQGKIGSVQYETRREGLQK